MKNPVVSVGIMHEKSISFELKGKYNCLDLDLDGPLQVELSNEGLIKICGTEIVGTELYLKADDSLNNSFILKDVTIGINFHWERKEDQTFNGDVKFVVENDAIRAINVLPVEEYLKSVISSEMSSTSHVELLKAHAIISRSWLMAQIVKNDKIKDSNDNYSSTTITDDEIIKWYDKEDHTLFDVCADDHCQRYQGVSRVATSNAFEAVDATRGMLIIYDNEICDARYSKSCGGVAEDFDKAWEPVVHPYLTKVVDNSELPVGFDLDLEQEHNSQEWIRKSPEAFCNTVDKKILGQVLNDYDQETTDFYRWRVVYTQTQLAELVKRRSGIDFGDIIALEPVLRGVSSRLIKLKIVGTKKSLTIGKELEIRKILSESHLYSSAFVVDTEGESTCPDKFILTGAGWGHGVGLCQIGAAVMANKGYDYKQILLHYFKNVELSNSDEITE